MNQEMVNGAMRLLREIEAQCRASAHPLPRQLTVKEDWMGIGFRLEGLRLVAPLDHVVEILTYPGMSKVPGAKNWVRGIANVRGNLLPIMDLQGYLTDKGCITTRLSRVLVLNHKGLFSGLIVDEVLGLKHFIPEQRIDKCSGVGVAMAPFVQFGFLSGDEHWHVFNMRRLAETPRFLQAAV